MEAKIKAEELVDKMYTCFQGHMDTYTAKQCALIAVDEILESIKIELSVDSTSFDVVDFAANRIKYWGEVKQEIEKL